MKWKWLFPCLAPLCYIIHLHAVCRGAAHCGAEILIQMKQAARQHKHNTYTGLERIYTHFPQMPLQASFTGKSETSMKCMWDANSRLSLL